MTYTDNSILTFGIHKFTALCRVPPEYLIELHTQNYPDNDLLKYIEENMELIKARLVGELPIPKLDFPCNKISYPTKKVAQDHLRRMESFNFKHKIPTRAYFCDRCGQWHLTSQEKYI